MTPQRPLTVITVGRPRKVREATIDYIEIGLSDGVRWRFSGNGRHAWEIETMPGDVMPTVRGPVRMAEFQALLEAERKRRALAATPQLDDEQDTGHG